MPDIIYELNTQMEAALSSRLALVLFWAPWCHSCHLAEHAMEEFARKYQQPAIFGKVNVGTHQQAANQYQVMTLPTLMIFRNGHPIAKLTANISTEAITDAVNGSER